MRDGTLQPDRRSLLLAIAIAGSVCGASYLLFGNHNLNLRDEGYLWYGVEAVRRGEIPFRDFQSYDPGRYFLAAPLASAFGGGLLGLRAAVLVFGALGMVSGLLVVRRILRSDLWMVPASILFLLWMFPRHKLFEPAITLVAVHLAVRLLERPTLRRHFAAGLFLGFAAFVGRNHGLYLVLALGGLLLLARKLPALLGEAPEGSGGQRLLRVALGVLLGYSPMLAMLVLVPGFAPAFWDSIVALLSVGANIPKDFPWPWTSLGEGAGGLAWLGLLAVRISFLLPIVVLPATLLRGLLRGRGQLFEPGDRSCTIPPALLVTPALFGIVYAHHFSVCSDLPHLAQAYPPILLATLALGASLVRGRITPAWSLLALLPLALFTAFEGNTEWKDYAPWEDSDAWVEREVAGQSFRLRPIQAAIVRRVSAAVARHVPADEPLFIAPTMPMWYPILDKATPVWWIYFLWPSGEDTQRRILEDLDVEHVRFALLIERSFTGLPEYDFDRTNPLVDRAITTGWSEVKDPQLPRAYHLYRRDG